MVFTYRKNHAYEWYAMKNIYNKKWEVKLYYGKRARNPEGTSLEGELAIYSWYSDDMGKDIEVNAGKYRPDIGKVKVLLLKPNEEWKTVYVEV